MIQKTEADRAKSQRAQRNSNTYKNIDPTQFGAWLRLNGLDNFMFSLCVLCDLCAIIVFHKMIQLDNISKSFDGVYAVRDLSVTVEKGEVFGLVGPNGAGKTTTINIMTGLLRPDAGSVTIGGYSITNEPMKAKAILGYVPDRAFLYEKLTAREFLKFIASIYDIEKSEALRKDRNSYRNLRDQGPRRTN